MNADNIRALQAPLKERYRKQPETARATLRAEGRFGEGVTCKVVTGKGPVTAGLHPATGGTGAEACSGDMLLESLVACAGVTLRAVAAAMELEVRDGIVTAEGELDFRGALGVAKDAPVGFDALRLTFELDTDATEGQVEILIRLTQRYCVIFQTLDRAVKIDVMQRIRRQDP
jgi:uncharacterized OsmC-like protein